MHRVLSAIAIAKQISQRHVAENAILHFTKFPHVLLNSLCRSKVSITHLKGTAFHCIEQLIYFVTCHTSRILLTISVSTVTIEYGVCFTLRSVHANTKTIPNVYVRVYTECEQCMHIDQISLKIKSNDKHACQKP